MADKRFPRDCTTECPHFHAWDMSVDDWTCVCDLLKVQIDDCDSNFQWMYCPLTNGESKQKEMKDMEKFLRDKESFMFEYGNNSGK